MIELKMEYTRWMREAESGSLIFIKVTLNGVVIVDADLEKIGEKPMDGAKHPGLKRAKGYIGFLGRTGRVEYRNIRIKIDPR